MTDALNPADFISALERENTRGLDHALEQAGLNNVIPIRPGLWHEPEPVKSTIVEAMMQRGVVPTEREMVFITMIEELREQIRRLKGGA